MLPFRLWASCLTSSVSLDGPSEKSSTESSFHKNGEFTGSRNWEVQKWLASGTAASRGSNLVTVTSSTPAVSVLPCVSSILLARYPGRPWQLQAHSLPTSATLAEIVLFFPCGPSTSLGLDSHWSPESHMPSLSQSLCLRKYWQQVN